MKRWSKARSAIQLTVRRDFIPRRMLFESIELRTLRHQSFVSMQLTSVSFPVQYEEQKLFLYTHEGRKKIVNDLLTLFFYDYTFIDKVKFCYSNPNGSNEKKFYDVYWGGMLAITLKTTFQMFVST